MRHWLKILHLASRQSYGGTCARNSTLINVTAKSACCCVFPQLSSHFRRSLRYESGDNRHSLSLSVFPATMTFEQRDTVVASGTTQSLQAYFCPLPATNWTRRAYHACESFPPRGLLATHSSAAIVVGDYVYIDGGEVALGQQPYSTNGSMPNPTYDPVGCKSLLLHFPYIDCDECFLC